MISKKDQIRKLLKGIETGDPESVTVVNEDKYIQHNPLTPEGSEGLAEPNNSHPRSKRGS
jgi:predicted SnoaL-like aldol condensation-catalyzing enzyme